MSEFSSFDILKLADLLRPPKDDNSDDEDQIPKPSVQTIDATNLNELESDKTTKTDNENNAESEEDSDPEEMARKYMEKECPQATIDWKKSPQWDVSYRQQVTPTDVFLQMGGKTPATSSCEEMILSVHLPGEKRQNVDVKITKERLNLISPNFKLDIPLPHPVDPQKGNAQFDSESEKLILTLFLDREFDFVNF
ncbi:dynein axonemal assembly factor 6 [Onthophagus taurus]|uniref:dynein axonemal assembly factor 6 n=1 Tax=Onthophagus taurus TaxID=166361 RepID=UPI0039BDD0BC